MLRTGEALNVLILVVLSRVQKARDSRFFEECPLVRVSSASDLHDIRPSSFPAICFLLLVQPCRVVQTIPSEDESY